METDSGGAIVLVGLGAVMAVVGMVLHAAVVYLPSSPPGVAVGPDMTLVSGEHHLVSAGCDRVSHSHRT